MFFIAGSFFDSPKSWTHTHGYESKFGTPIFEMVNTPKILWLPSSNQTWQCNDESHQSVRLFFPGKILSKLRLMTESHPLYKTQLFKKPPWITTSSPLVHYEKYYYKSWTKLTINHYNRRKFRSETSDNMDSWKAEVRRVRREKIRREKIRRERVRRKKMQMREKVGKSRFTVFFQWFVAPQGWKVGSLKRRVRSQLARWEMKKCTPLWREAPFQVKMYKTHHSRTTFGSCDVEKVHAVVARSTFPSQNVQNTAMSDHFWKLRCRKSARRCGAKHISKSKCTKHTSFGPLLEVQMSKKCTPLWREAHFQVKMYKTHQLRTTFGSCDVEKVHAVVARSTFPSEKC